MRHQFALLMALLGAAGAFAQNHPAGHWKLQFFHDKLDSTLIFMDLACPSAVRCIAVGAVSSEKSKLHPTAVITSDAGEHWSYVDLKEAPYSVFFLNADLGWIAADRGIWQTTDGGTKWNQLAKLEDIEQVWFLDSSTGWAAGRGAKLYSTRDGGKRWTKENVSGLSWPADQVAFEAMAFTSAQSGFLMGSAFPFGQLRTIRPDWLDPERAKRHRAPPAISFPVVTRDGGQTWTTGKSFATSGTLTRVRHTPDGHALAILEFPEGSKFPSQVVDVDPAAGKSSNLFEFKDRVIKDILPLPGGETLIAAIQPPGSSFSLPVPGKLKLLRAKGSDVVGEMGVDYRAIATNAVMAAFDAGHIWIATDTGMILHFETNPAASGLSTGLPPTATRK